MTKRSEARRSEDGDAVRVLAPDPNPRRAQAVKMAPSSPPPSPGAALIVAAVVGLLGITGFAVLVAPGDDSVSETLAPVPVAVPEIAATEAVAPGRAIDLTSSWVAGGGIAGGGEVADAVVGQARLVAAGAAGSSAAVWASPTGNVWEAATYVETPSGSASRIQTIAYGNDGWIGVGTVDGDAAVWRAEVWQTWEFLGQPPGLAGLEGIVAVTLGPGDQYWLVGSDADGPMLWASTDGLRWIKHDPGFAPAEIVVKTAAAAQDDGGWLYLAGSRCRDAVCRPALWKTQDGTNWIDAETAAGLPGGELSEDSGAVAAMSVAANRIVAAGSSDVSGFSVPTIWVSRDGVTWAASGEAAFGSRVVNIRLQGVSDTEPGTASVTVAGRQVGVAAGDSLVTAVGVVSVTSVDHPRVTLRFGDEEIDLGTGSAAALRVNRGIESVAAQGDRIVALGFESDRSGASRVPVAWTSAVGSSDWDMHRLPDRGDLPAFVGLNSRRAIALSVSGESWHHDWDGSAVAAAAIEVVVRMVTSVADGDLADVIATLPETRSDLHGPLEFPGLADWGSDWWDRSSDHLDPFALAGALAFVTELDTAVHVFDCTARPLWGQGLVAVNCRVSIKSNFLGAMELTEDRGMLAALVAEGAVVSVMPSWSGRAWQELEHWARKADPEAASLLLGGEDGGTSPQIDAALATTALAWAERYRDTFLLPGDSIDVATPVGSMTWSVIDPFGGHMVDSIVFARGAFWTLLDSRGSDAVPGDLMLWRSEDGIEWEAVGELPTGDWWGPMAGADRLFAVGGSDEARMLGEWNGAGWTEFEIPIPEAGEWWLHSIAESNDRVLVLGEGWDERGDRPLGSALWAQAPGGGFEVVAVEGPDLSREAPLSLIGMESGFVLILSHNGSSASATEVWGSPDGATWELLTDEPGFADGWLRWVGTVGGDLVALTFGGEDCSGIGEPCRTVWQQWSSAGGIDWELVGELHRDGTVAGGPLGLVAISQGDWSAAPEPMSVLMSDGAGQFVELTELGVRFPGADWIWAGEIAMSDQVVVAPISGAFEGAPGEMDADSWLLVGRLLGP